MSSKKILYLFDSADWNSRIPVAKKAMENGADVTIGLIGDRQFSEEESQNYNIQRLARPVFSPTSLSYLDTMKQMRDLIKTQQPDYIHAVTLKYSFLTGMASAGINDKSKKIYTFAGLGYLFRSNETKSHLLRSALHPALTRVFNKADTTLVFQNADDLELMVRKHYANSSRSKLILGSGVDLNNFYFEDNTQNERDINVLMPTRLVHEKGVSVFVEAARMLKAKGVNARFQIAGGETDNPKAISRAEMEEMTKDGAVEWLGKVEDMPSLFAKTSLVVYPSYYGEGIPRVLLESCAAGKAIVTTDHPGCREAVRHGENGLLVPVKDILSTAQAIAELLSKPEMRREMGQASRARAEKDFDINVIAEQTAALYDL